LQETKKGGRYTKDEQRKRRDEVHRLHFEYGYSARKIAEFLKMNRGTINRDVSYWYADIDKKWDKAGLKKIVINQVERLELQRTRLRKQLDNTNTFQERITIEKFIFNIDSKIASVQTRVLNASQNLTKNIIYGINQFYEKEDGKKRIISPDVFLKVSKEANEKIQKIYEEDMKL